MDEKVVLLSQVGDVVGSMSKKLVHTHATPLHLAFSCYLFDQNGQLLITRRAEDKPTWPGIWTNTCCGHPAPEESLTAAINRRLSDELNLEALREVDLILPHFRYQVTMPNGIMENEMCPVFAGWITQQPKPNPAEVAAYDWIAWPEFAAMVLSGDRQVSPWCQLQVSELVKLGPDPRQWPIADPVDLPPAAAL